MRNLAGSDDADIHCAAELTAAGAEIAILPEPRNAEVRTRVTGKIGDIALVRAWYYWVASGKVPLAVALRLYADPVGKKDVRVAGHCGCPPPETPWIDWFDGAEEVVIDPDGSQEAEYDRFIARGSLSAESKPRFAKSTEGLTGYITTYHIDSAEGLRLFVDALREQS